MSLESKYDKLDMVQVKKLATFGHTDEFMADFFDVAKSTWNEWKKKHPKFFEALKSWKDVADYKVEKALYEKATGYSIEAEKVTKDGQVVPFTASYPPDTTACIFWLKNRKRKEWRDKQEHEHTGTMEHDHIISADPVALKACIKQIVEGDLEDVMR